MRLDASSHAQGKSCTLFSGHVGDAQGPARGGRHDHLFLALAPDAAGTSRAVST
jgi:hypothetical protein